MNILLRQSVIWTEFDLVTPWIHTTSIALSANVLDWRSYKTCKNLISVLCIMHSKFHVGTVYSSCTSGWGTSCSRWLGFLNSLHIVSFYCVFISCYAGIVSSFLMLHSLQVDKYIWSSSCVYGGTWWHSWLRHCATNQKVMGSIPGDFIGILHWLNPSPLTDMSTRNISWGVKAAGT